MAGKASSRGPLRSLGIRARVDLVNELERIAAQNGRSLAMECEMRLAASLSDQDQREVIAEVLAEHRPKSLLADEMNRFDMQRARQWSISAAAENPKQWQVHGRPPASSELIMAHETVPADIVVAIEAFRQATRTATREPSQRNAEASGAARAALNAAILRHLRGVEEMKAALELQTSGAA